MKNTFLHFLVIVLLNIGCLHAAESAPVTARQWNARGIEMSHSGQDQPALNAFTKAIQLQPALADPYVNRAIVFIKLKEWEKADADCTKAIELDADSARGYHQRAIVRSQTGRHEAAFKDASRAARMEPTNPSIIFIRYLTSSRLGRHDLGHFAGETYIGIQSWSDTWSPYIAILNSVSLRRAGDDEEARAILTEAARWLDRDKWPMPVGLYLLGNIDADTLMKQAADDDRKTLAHYYIGINEWLDGEVASAKVHFEWVRDHGNKDFLQHMLAEDHLKEIATAEK